MVIGLQLSSKPIEFVRENTVEVIKNVEVTPEWATDEDAVKAAKAVIRKKELEVQIAGLDEEIAKLQEQRKTASKELGTYWREGENLRQEVRAKAEEYGVSAYAMSAIINCESQGSTTVQSNHRYTVRNVPKGYQVGDREQSFGLVQIHLPAHPHITREQAVNPEFAIEFLAKNLKAGDGWMWTCAKTLALI